MDDPELFTLDAGSAAAPSSSSAKAKGTQTGDSSESVEAFAKLRQAFAADAGLRQETEWAYRLAVETYNPSDRGLRFITGGIGEWIVTLAAYRAGLITLPGGHNADGHDTVSLLNQSRGLWSVKTSYKKHGKFTITNGQGGAGAGLVVPTIFLSPCLPGIVLVDPAIHPDVVAHVEFAKDSTKLSKSVIGNHAEQNPACVIPLAMPVNPGAAVTDPALEAVKILVDNVNFPRLRSMFADAARDDSVVAQLRDLQRLRENGILDEIQYQAAVNKVAGVR